MLSSALDIVAEIANYLNWIYQNVQQGTFNIGL